MLGNFTLEPNIYRGWTVLRKFKRMRLTMSMFGNASMQSQVSQRATLDVDSFSLKEVTYVGGWNHNGN